MAWQTMTTPQSYTAYTASDFKKVTDNLIWLYNQRPSSSSTSSTTAWTVTAYAGGGDYEDDPNMSLSLSLTVDSTVFVLALITWDSNTARDEALRVRLKYGASYTSFAPYQGEPDANCYQQYVLFAVLTGQTGSLTLKLSAGKANSGDTVTIRDRQLLALVVPED